MSRLDTARAIALLLPLLLTGCRNDMHDQPRYKPYAATDFFDDRRSARPTIEDTVARGQLRTDLARFTGKENGKDVETIPIQITRQDLARGQERFDIYCSPCHGRLGDGNGMIVQRGFRHPPTYHDDRLRQAPIGHFFDVITNGYGSMYPYAARVPVDDRWRIAAYIRALQLSQNAGANDVPPDQRAQLQVAPQTDTPPGKTPAQPNQMGHTNPVGHPNGSGAVR